MKPWLGISMVVLTLFWDCRSKDDRLNILFIAVDDLRPELGCYGNDRIRTPHIDRVAKQGFIFKHHYVQVPTCGASRFSLLTGMRPRARTHLLNSAIADELAGAPESEVPESFVHQLRRHGYRTVGIGKIGHSADGLIYGYEDRPSSRRELPHSWDEFFMDTGKWGTGWNAFFGYANGENRQSLKKQVKPYEKGAVDDLGYPDGLSTELALKKLRELKEMDQPFFLGVGYFKPHLPFNAPEKYWDLYHEDSLPLPAFTGVPTDVSRASLHQSNEFNQYALGEEKAHLDTVLSETYSRKLIHAYYACVSYIDAQIGQLMQELEMLDLAENTMVVIWGDHGWHLGELRVWGKHTLSEYALRSVLVMRIPGRSGHGIPVTLPIEAVDIYPTLMELCEVSIPVGIDGESFTDQLKVGNPTERQEVAYSYFRNGISMRTDSFRLTQYFRQEQPAIELYNYYLDPHETRNLAGELPDKVTELLPLLGQGDTGLYRDSQ